MLIIISKAEYALHQTPGSMKTDLPSYSIFCGACNGVQIHQKLRQSFSRELALFIHIIFRNNMKI
jgi:hypothetical protein